MTNQFTGMIASVHCYTESHRLLTLRLKRPGSAESDVFLKCYFCKGLPNIQNWTVSELIVLRPAEYSAVLLDVQAAVAIFCSEVTITEDINLRGSALL